MSSRSDEHFEDLQLKAALKRTLSGGKAPSSLRQRIHMLLYGALATILPTEQELLAEAAPVAEAPTPMQRQAAETQKHSFWSRPLGIRSLIAAAAMVIVGISLASYVTFTEPEWLGASTHGISQARGPAITEALIKDIMSQHDTAAIDPAAKLKIPATPTSDLTYVRQTLAQQINRPVWVADLRREGWQFRGASVCDISGQETAHVLFTKGDFAVSLMSMPGPDVCHGALPDDYDQWVNNHAVCVFGARGQLFAMVGSSPKGELAMGEVSSLLTKFKAEAIATANQPSRALASIDEPLK